MTQPGTPPPPFEPTPFGPPVTSPGLAPGKERSGCGRAALIGCGALVVVCGLVLILVAANAKRAASFMLTWSFNKLEQQISAQMPADVTPAERERLSAAFASAVRAAKEGRVDPARAQTMQGQVLSIARRPKGKITRQDILDLTQSLEGMAQGTPATTPGKEGFGKGAAEGEPVPTEVGNPTEPGPPPAP
jgi:hypothetical protein